MSQSYLECPPWVLPGCPQSVVNEGRENVFGSRSHHTREGTQQLHQRNNALCTDRKNKMIANLDLFIGYWPPGSVFSTWHFPGALCVTTGTSALLWKAEFGILCYRH